MEVALNQLLEPIRKKFESPELRKLTNSAYPSASKTSECCALHSWCVVPLSHHFNSFNTNTEVWLVWHNIGCQQPYVTGHHLCVCVFSFFVCVWSEAAGKGAKAGGGGAGGDNDELAPSRLDIRVGKIVSVEKVGRQYHLWSASSDDVCWDDPPVSQSSVFVHMIICCPPHSIQMPTRCTWRRLM